MSQSVEGSQLSAEDFPPEYAKRLRVRHVGDIYGIRKLVSHMRIASEQI